MKKNNYYPKNYNENIIPNTLPSNEEFYDDYEDDIETFRSIKEATAQNGYIDLSKEIMAQTNIESEQKNGPTFFEITNPETEAKKISAMVTKSEHEKKIEKKKEWGKLLSSMNTIEDEYAVCSHLSGEVIFEFLTNTMENIDAVYSKFTKQPSRYARHCELLEEIKKDLSEEEHVIEEYKAELKRLEM